MGILSDKIVMSEKVLRGEQDPRNVNLVDHKGAIKISGYYAEGKKYPDNRQTIDGGGTVGKDGSLGYETINDSKDWWIYSKPCFCGSYYSDLQQDMKK